MNLLILGGNSDIGMAIARRFAEKEKASIILASRNEEELQRNASDLSIRYGVETHTVPFDVRDFASHAVFYENLPLRPDGVVLAFGYLGDQQLAQQDTEELRKIIETNYSGAASILEVVASDFEAREISEGTGPFIIGISSAAGERGRQSNYIYGSAKAGLTALLSGMRQRLHCKNILVTTVKPGYVDTKMTAGMELPRLLTLSPELVARTTWRAWRRKKSVTYVSWYWRLILSAMKMVPEFLFKRLNV